MGQGRLDIRGLGKRFRVDGAALAALDGIDLSVEPGSFIVVVGASGCGKSTLLRLIAGLDRADGGEITMDGAPVRGPSLDRGRAWCTDQAWGRSRPNPVWSQAVRT